jgi:hypothetical protein
VLCTLGFPGQIVFEKALARGQVLLRRAHVAPAIERAARHALEHHDVAGPAERQRGKHEVFAYARNHVERDARIVWRLFEAVHVGQRERTLWLVERRARRVALEEPHHFSLAAGENDEVVRVGERFELGDACILNHKTAAARFDLLQPRRHLHALVDRLRRLVETCFPVDHLRAALLRMRHREANAVHLGARALPIVDTKIALDLQRRVEHALTRHDLAAADVLRRAIAHHSHFVALFEQPERQRQARLAAPHNCDSTHG